MNSVQTWVLVTSAFVLGLVLGAAAFVGVWRATASENDRADAARALTARQLHAARAQSETLATRLHRVKTQLAATRRDEKHLKVQLRSAVEQAAAANGQAAADRASILALRHRAKTVSSYVASLDAYVKSTPSQDLDGYFLRSQLVYLSAAARRLQTQ